MGTKNETIMVTVLNWEKFNPRRDIKHPSWFAFSNRMLEDEDFLDFSADEFMAWVYILCKASQKNSGSVKISVAHAHQICRIKPKNFLNAIKKLQSSQIVHVDDTNTLRLRTDSVREREPTDTTDRQTNTTNNIGVFDFEIIYQKYPRKEGKQKGLAICERSITTPEDYLGLERAVDRYKSICKEKGTETKYIKQFSTFMASWRDWLDPLTGTGESFEKSGFGDWQKYSKTLNKEVLP